MADAKGTKRLKLSNGGFTLIDEDIYQQVAHLKWWKNCNGYVLRSEGRKDRKTTFLHRLINKTPDGFITDHINRDILDNRRANLRTVNKSLNALNGRKHKDNKSGYKGICWDKQKSKWLARICVNYKAYHIGRYSSLEEAVSARESADKRLLNGVYETINV